MLSDLSMFFFLLLDKQVVFLVRGVVTDSVCPPAALLQVSFANRQTASQPVEASKEPFFSRKREPDPPQPATCFCQVIDCYKWLCVSEFHCLILNEDRHKEKERVYLCPELLVIRLQSDLSFLVRISVSLELLIYRLSLIL